MIKPNFAELLAMHVAAEKLTSQEAKALDNASRFDLEPREVLSYLGGFIAFIGLARIIVGPFIESSTMAVAVAFYILGLAVGVASFRWVGSPAWKNRLAEALEIIAVTSEVIAVGISLALAGVSSELAVFFPALAASAWAIVRRQHSEFSSALLLPAGVLTTALALCALVDLSGTKNSLIIGVAAAGLIAVGTRPMNLAAVPRLVGAVTIVGCAISLYSEYDGVLVTLCTLVIAGAYFAWATRTRWLVLVGSSVITVFLGLLFLINRLVNNSIIQGLLMLVTGATTLVTVGLYTRRRASQQSPAAPTA